MERITRHKRFLGTLENKKVARYSYNPAQFCGTKFKTRYGLREEDFWADRTHVYVREGVRLSDDPPVFEAPTARISTRDRIDAAQTLAELKEVLKEVL